MQRVQGQIYAEIAAHEGYQWGGGCWNDNNRDDAPGDPTENMNTRGEGGDCSGFTWKTWFETWNEDDAGFTYHYRMQNQSTGLSPQRMYKDGWRPMPI